MSSWRLPAVIIGGGAALATAGALTLPQGKESRDKIGRSLVGAGMLTGAAGSILVLKRDMTGRTALGGILAGIMGPYLLATGISIARDRPLHR